jgi:hypothetical protein
VPPVRQGGQAFGAQSLARLTGLDPHAGMNAKCGAKPGNVRAFGSRESTP